MNPLTVLSKFSPSSSNDSFVIFTLFSNSTLAFFWGESSNCHPESSSNLFIFILAFASFAMTKSFYYQAIL